MKRLFPICLAVAACTSAAPPNPPPHGEFYYPTGIAHAPSDAGPDGILYVASFNLDKRYDNGSVLAVNLANVVRDADAGLFGLPALGDDAGGELQISDLGIADAGAVLIQSFAGEMGLYPMADRVRLFVPARAEGDYLHVIDAFGDTLICYGDDGSDRNCEDTAVSLTSLSPPGDAGITQIDSKPRAPQPYGVGISAAGQVYVTHLGPADDPVNSGLLDDSYLVIMDAGTPANPVNQSNFVSLALQGYYAGNGSSVAIGQRFAYVSARFVSPTPSLIRLYDTWSPSVTGVGLEQSFGALEARGLALSEDESHLYLATRSPDALLVFAISEPTSPPSISVPVNVPGYIRVQETQMIPLPQGPSSVRVISRKSLGRGDLVVIACQAADAVVIYDQDLASIVKTFPSVGFQPFDVAVDNRGTGARFYVSAFAESRILVFDMPDLTQPEGTTLAARLGTADTCFTTPTDPSCPTLPNGGFVP